MNIAIGDIPYVPTTVLPHSASSCTPQQHVKSEGYVQATKDHASECEQRATAAEATLKDVQHELHTAQNDAEDSKQELQSAQSHHQEVLKDVRVRADFDLQEARTSANKVLPRLSSPTQFLLKRKIMMVLLCRVCEHCLRCVYVQILIGLVFFLTPALAFQSTF